MNDAILHLVLERLADDATLPAAAAELILAACDGPDALTARLDADLAPAIEPASADVATEPPGAYLRSVAVQGFRGIGRRAVLDVEPGPGLTLVIGRNGSGKSSFSEGLELLLTGASHRWQNRSRIWTEGWRNLHDGAATTLTGTFVVEGRSQPVVIERGWSSADDLTNAVLKLTGTDADAIEELGWAEPLATYRPFLSYNELGSLFEEGPSKLHDQLSSMLGLEDLVTLERILREQRQQREAGAKDVSKRLPPILAALAACDDERARESLDALSGRSRNLDRVELALEGLVEVGNPEGDLTTLRALATLTEPPAERIELVRASLANASELGNALRGTDSERARDLQELLELALAAHEHRGSEPCPVCGEGTLDEVWQRRAEASVAQLRREAAQAEAARRATRDAFRGLREVVSSAPPVLARATGVGIDAGRALEAWAVLSDVPEDVALTSAAEHLANTYPPLTSALASLRERAEAELGRREDVWRPVAAQLRDWVRAARAAAADAERVASLKEAEAWVKKTNGLVRNQRFQPIAAKARANWALLRQGSNVEVEEIVLSGTGTQRRVDLEVTIDGVPGQALGVMSQGELHALALGLFLPRASLPESPFRFVVIDDPVQAMDPAKVDGLARVLESAAGRARSSSSPTTTGCPRPCAGSPSPHGSSRSRAAKAPMSRCTRSATRSIATSRMPWPSR